MTSVKQKSRMGRPVTIDADQSVGVRLPRRLVKAVDGWADHEAISRSEAIRRLLEQALAAGSKGKR